MIALFVNLLLAFVLVMCLIGLLSHGSEHGYGLSGIGRSRKYKSGTRWCFWRWTDTDSEYILRLHIFKAPFGAVCLHWIRKPDAEPWAHDHPVSFLSLILRGGYAEYREVDGVPSYRVHRWWNAIRTSPNDRHRIVFVRRNTLTLCLMGPKRREWGFHIHERFIGWKEYYRLLRDGKPVRTDDYWEYHYNADKRGYYTVDRETFYKNVQLDWEGREEDFIDEAPTEPKSRYGEGAYGKGPFGGDRAE